MSKVEQLQIRVSVEQKARIRERARRAGEDVSKWVLRRLLAPLSDEFQACCAALANRGGERSLLLAELHDFLAGLSGKQLIEATCEVPPARLGPFEANYVAAMVEHACVAQHVEPPTWLRDIEPLLVPWFATSLTRLRLHLLMYSPPAFRRRNLFVDSTIGDRV